jgi:hypothetical protein
MRSLSALTTLRSLSLAHCRQLTDRGAEALMPLLPGLTALDLRECVLLKAAARSAILKRMPYARLECS